MEDSGCYYANLAIESASDQPLQQMKRGAPVIGEPVLLKAALWRLAQLIPDELIVEVIEFETQEPEFADEKTMTVKFTDVVGGTEVSLLYENVPAGIRPEDNETGSRQALQKLAALVE
ncbi:MAG: SRPBCC domain-containing protein [Anaerolineales bacterium]|nr:SRPBCC domain-containing protein [Anaerolineales bacterium]